jgi:hypothetical protein
VGAVTWAAAREVAVLGSELSALRVQLLNPCKTQRYTASELTACGAPVQHPHNAETHADERQDGGGGEMKRGLPKGRDCVPGDVK